MKESKKVFVISKDGKPLDPTNRFGKIRKWLKNGEAKIISHEPFTIQLLKETTFYTQHTILGIDSGYSNVGFSVITEKEELYSGELQLRNDIKDLISAKKMYRNQRRSKLRYREPRFDNRKRNEGWLAPSIEHKKNSHITLINKICKILPIKKIIIETGNFDIQKINNPDIVSIDYQEGEQLGFSNVKDYIRHRDNFECQNPNCKNNNSQKILQVHHIKFKKFGGTDNPNNLITLCSQCHKPEDHLENGYLYKWMLINKKVKEFKGATFMNIVKEKLYNEIKQQHFDKEVINSFGWITKSKRVLNKDNKTHYNDAFYIADGNQNIIRCSPITLNIIRRNNRSLSIWKDAKYINIRTGEIVSANQLNNGRSKRNKETNTENLRKYRQPITKKINEKLVRDKKGVTSIRIKKHEFQNGDLIRIIEDYKSKYVNLKKGYTFISSGTSNKGKYILIKKIKYKDSKGKCRSCTIYSEKCQIIKQSKGIVKIN